MVYACVPHVQVKLPIGRGYFLHTVLINELIPIYAFKSYY